MSSEFETMKDILGEHTYYLGDAVFVGSDGYHIIVATTDGTSITNKIYLDPSVSEGLVDYIKYIDNLKNEKVE